MNFTVVQGDIAAQSADALVNAAGTSLRMGSGVAGALRRGGGPELNEAAMAKGPIDLGAVAVTDAFDLDAEVVIHAAAMPHDGDGQATAASIRDAVSVPVLCEGGIRERGEIDRLLGDACDAVGMARPFYAEPGVCRTPAVLARAGTLRMEGAYDTDAETADADEADPEG